MSKYVTHEYEVFSSELMLHTKIQFVRTYAPHENMMSGFRTYIKYENV